MKRSVTDIGASVRARLSTLAREKGVAFELILVRYVHERLLYRLGQSKYQKWFVLKGAMLQTIWLADPFRPTRGSRSSRARRERTRCSADDLPRDSSD
jgi:hypothetical protein